MLRLAEEVRRLQQDMLSVDGRRRVAQSMYEPFKEGRDYVGLKDKVIWVYNAEDGAPIWFDLDPQFSASTISVHGAVPKTDLTYERVELVPYPIVVLLTCSVLDVHTARFNLLDRVQKHAAAEMAEKEDLDLITLFSNAAGGTRREVTRKGRTLTTGTVAQTASSLTRTALSTTYAEIEQFDTPVANVLMTAKDWNDVRGTWTDSDYDRVTQAELVKTGYMGDLWNAAIRITKQCTYGTVLVLADPEFLGVWAVRVNLESADASQFSNQQLRVGWVFYEYVAPAQLTSVGSTKLTISR